MHKHEQCSSNIILVETLGSTVFPIFHFTRKLKGISHSESVRVQHDAVLAGEVQMLAPSNDTLSILAYDLGHGRLPLSHHAHLLPFSISLAHLTLTSVSTIATVCLCKNKKNKQTEPITAVVWTQSIHSIGEMRELLHNIRLYHTFMFVWMCACAIISHRVCIRSAWAWECGAEACCTIL